MGPYRSSSGQLERVVGDRAPSETEQDTLINEGRRRRVKERSPKRKLWGIWRRIRYPLTFVVTCYLVVLAIRWMAED